MDKEKNEEMRKVDDEMRSITRIETVDMGRPAPTRALATTVRTPADILIYAMEKGGNIEQIEKLLELQMRWEANEARKQYVADMAEFKKNPPTITKDKLVAFNGISYMHATLGNVTNAIVEGLAAHGFSHNWAVRQSGGMIEVDCVITHRMGHSEMVSMQAGKDDSGKKNAIQQVSSSITYLQRYTLLAATGLATHDQQDDDGHAAEAPSIGDKWKEQARMAKDVAALEAIWKAGEAEIKESGSEADYRDLLDAVNARKAKLESPPSNKSSRLKDIVGNGEKRNEHG